MDVQVCIGSCCHKRNSYDVLKKVKSLVNDNKLNENIHVSSAFCLGHCKEGVSMKVDGQIITGVSLDNIEDIFNKYINI